ncbi:MAG TPA: RNA polymerase sigma factor RpoD/SigA [Saprospiraceae bacterium]|nr:RNA polymerase sigma factor RpoD/SigA [Saprospiraceae bacterium]MCB9328485.1 RNA polymerase sigma factor RpoD/SigA [Lewinellaceae bacterium]HPQ21811.1 RNA polymerase sigma factor RpoD/SigA [Saprospiraceae bacterium]
MRQLKISKSITNRDSYTIDKYLSDISKIDILTTEEEAELARRIKSGDDNALFKLTQANLRFVVSVAKQYQNQGLSLSDLINEGNVGLMKAAKRFDETKGFKFISYAVWWIRQSILHAIVEYSRMVRLPFNKLNSYNKVNDAYVTFLQKYEREPTHEELAEILEMKTKDIANMLRGGLRHLSMDAPIGEEEGSISMIDLMADENFKSPDFELLEESLRDELKMGMKLLSPREREILSSFYGLDGEKAKNLDEIAHIFGLTRERVRQLRDRALRRLRRSINKTQLITYL